MLKVGGVILSLFQLVLGVLFKLTPDTINKSLRVFNVLSEKVLKLWPYDWGNVLVVALVLGPSDTNSVAKENGGIWGIIHPCGA